MLSLCTVVCGRLDSSKLRCHLDTLAELLCSSQEIVTVGFSARSDNMGNCVKAELCMSVCVHVCACECVCMCV